MSHVPYEINKDRATLVVNGNVTETITSLLLYSKSPEFWNMTEDIFFNLYDKFHSKVVKYQNETRKNKKF